MPPSLPETTDTSAAPEGDPPQPSRDRRLLLAGGVLVQLAIGAVYAWSTFGNAFQDSVSALHLTKVQAALPFEVAIGMIFLGAFTGGHIQDRKGPRAVALTGVTLYAAGILLSSLAREPGQMWILVLGYGLLSGFGLGLAYIVPIAMLQKWFPDKAGLVTGIAVGGFGFGAVLTSPIARILIDRDPAHPAAAFAPLGLAYLAAGLLGASIFANPPEGYRPPTARSARQAPRADIAEAAAGDDAVGARSGRRRPIPQEPVKGATRRDFTQMEALHTHQWFLLTLTLTVTVTAGISLVSVAAGASRDIAGYTPDAAAGLVGLLGLFNGGGRIFWAWLSDRIGKTTAFVGILSIQGLCLIALPYAGHPLLFGLVAAAIYTCYGGGFGTMPSMAGQYFGVTHAGAIYGLMLMAWSIGGVTGPLLTTTLLGNHPDHMHYVLSFTTVGVISLLGAAIPFVTKRPKRPRVEPVPDAAATG